MADSSKASLRPEKTTAELRALRQAARPKGGAATIDPADVAGLARSLSCGLLTPANVSERKAAPVWATHYVDLLAIAAPHRALRAAMAETLPLVATQMARDGAGDMDMLNSHRQLARLATLVARTELAQAVPVEAIVQARANAARHDMFEPWAAVTSGFDRAIAANPVWKTRLAQPAAPNAEGAERAIVRHGGKAEPAPQTQPRAATPAQGDGKKTAYYKGTLEGPKDVEARMTRYMADPRNGLREAVQVAKTAAPHPALRPGLAKHHPELARRLIRAVRRDARNGDLLTGYVESVGAPAFAAAAVPRRQLKAAMGALPVQDRMRLARFLDCDGIPAAIKRTVVEADADAETRRALKTLTTAKAPESYRKVIDRFEAIGDESTRRKALKPVLPRLFATIFRHAEKDRRALAHVGRLIPLASRGALRESGMTSAQAEDYVAFARETGREDTVAILAGALSIKRAKPGIALQAIVPKRDRSMRLNAS